MGERKLVSAIGKALWGKGKQGSTHLSRSPAVAFALPTLTSLSVRHHTGLGG